MTLNSFFERQKSAARAVAHDPCEHEVKVVGVTFEGRQRVILSLHVGDSLQLRREPENPYDRNAIRVETLDGRQVGYLPRELAERLAPGFDRHDGITNAVVTALSGGNLADSSRGVRIRFFSPEDPSPGIQMPEDLEI